MPERRGLVAEFDCPEKLVAAVRAMRLAGYRHLDAGAPMPVDGLGEALAPAEPSSWRPVALGALLGAAVGFGLTAYASYVYPVGVGGARVWPATLLLGLGVGLFFAALFAVFGALGPRPARPTRAATRYAVDPESFFLIVEATDPRLDASRTRNTLAALQPQRIAEAEPAA